MANLAVTNTFVAATTILSAAVNTNFSDIVSFVNNRNSASSSWDQLAVAGNAAITGTLTNTGAVTASSTLHGVGAVTFDSTLAVTGVATFTAVPVFSSTSAYTIPGALTLSKTTNQLVLGTTNTTTITSAAPASSRTYSIPDAGGAADFVMTAGSQTIAGTKTFSTPIAFGSGGTSVTHQLIKSATYSGNSVTRDIAHGLGVIPTMIIIIETDSVNPVPPIIWTSDFANQSGGSRNFAGGYSAASYITAVDSTNFGLGTAAEVNTTGRVYQWVAFAAQ